MRLLAYAVTFMLSTSAHAQPAGFGEGSFNGRKPVHANGVTTFTVQAADCSKLDYGDGRGESDCFNGNLRSRITYRKYAKLGDSLQYSFDIFIPESLTYNGGPNSRSLLEVAEWQRINTIKNHIHQMHLDARKGLAFDNVVCLRPSAFGRWNRIVVQIRWSMDEDGRTRVICNDQVVLSRYGRSAIPPDCGAPGVFQCVPALQEPKQPIQFNLGILFRGFSEFRGQEGGFGPSGRVPPPEGFTIQIRNASVQRVRFD